MGRDAPGGDWGADVSWPEDMDAGNWSDWDDQQDARDDARLDGPLPTSQTPCKDEDES